METRKRASTHMHKWINEWTYPRPAKSDTRFPKAAAKKMKNGQVNYYIEVRKINKALVWKSYHISKLQWQYPK